MASPLPITPKRIEAAKRALVRAYAEGCHGRFVDVWEQAGVAYGQYVSPTGETYHVCDGGCTCKAGARGLLCKHRVALADLVGTLDRYIPGVYNSDNPLAA